MPTELPPEVLPCRKTLAWLSFRDFVSFYHLIDIAIGYSIVRYHVGNVASLNDESREIMEAALCWSRSWQILTVKRHEETNKLHWCIALSIIVEFCIGKLVVFGKYGYLVSAPSKGLQSLQISQFQTFLSSGPLRLECAAPLVRKDL